jgi:cytochrome c-type biogenesis protein CcmH
VRNLFFCLLLAVLYIPANAKEALPVAENPALEKRVMDLSEELRCLVCQNQSLAESHAELAIDLKNQVREKLAQGMSNRDVIDYMVQRYGDFVLYRPPVKSVTWLLWFGPFVLLFGGVGLLIHKLRRRRVQDLEMSAAEVQRAEALLGTNVNTKETR